MPAQNPDGEDLKLVSTILMMSQCGTVRRIGAWSISNLSEGVLMLKITIFSAILVKSRFGKGFISALHSV